MHKVLEAVVEQELEGFVLGRIATFIQEGTVAQRHKDGREFEVFWRDRLNGRRCTIFLQKGSELCLAMIDINHDGSIHVECFEPCSITVSPEENLICLVRFTPGPGV